MAESPEFPPDELSVDYERADVQDFTKEQQERFLKNWFRAAFLRDHPEGALSADEWKRQQQAKAEERTRTIITYLTEEQNKGLRQLAAIPMILQIMAILWKEREYLPKSRVKLYNAVLDYLLELRDGRRGIASPLPAEDARLVLGPVSLWMQEELKKDEAERSLMQKKMQKELDTLRDRTCSPPSAADFCDHLVKRAGLLMEYGSTHYVFRHKSFREYLAGVELLKKVERTTGYLDILIAGFGDDWWEEPIRFFIAQADEVLFDLFMEKLFDSPQSNDLSPKKATLLLTLIDEARRKKVDALCKKLLDPATDAGRQRVILDCLKAVGKPAALEALQEFRSKKLARENRDVASRAEEVILLLGGQVVDGESEKRSAGISESLRNQNEQSAEYILIPGGSYIYSDTGQEEQVDDLYVAKYPVTNKLYRAFIAYLESKGAEHEALLPLSVFHGELDSIARNNAWGKEFGEYLKKGKNDFAAHFRSRNDEDRKFGGDDQPVVSITWYAARSYCLWLSMLEGERTLYRLPTEIEWEWAAGGKEKRSYPWGEKEPSSLLANYNEIVGATTPVGSYPEGMTPEGLYDMAGNVWEWMENWYDENEAARSLRGGSWSSYSDYLRCSCRSYFNPDDGDDDVGFRVVRSSPS